MTFTLNKKHTIFYYITITAIGVLLAVFYFNSLVVNSNKKLVNQTNVVINKNNEILLNIINIETGVRGYALTNEVTFLGPYYESQQKINRNLAQLITLTKDNPIQQTRIKKLKETIDARIRLSKSVVNNRMENHGDKELELQTLLQGKLVMDSIRNDINRINFEELGLLNQRTKESSISVEASNIILFTLFLFLLLLVFFINYLIKNHNKRNSLLELFNKNQKEISQYSLSLIEASLDPLVTINNEGKITDLNQATVKVTGIAKEDLIGSDFFDYFTDHQKAREVYQDVFSKGSVIDAPLTIRHKEGKLTDVLFNGSVYKDELGKTKGVVIVARDIAEQKWAMDLRSANNELAFQNEEKEKRADELAIANKELLFQNEEKEKRAAELVIANEELAYQNEEKQNRADELTIANLELEHQNEEKEKRADELLIANKELEYQNKIKGKKASELIIANKELAFQNEEKEKRAQELIIANKELLFQNNEKQNRADELEIADIELNFQNKEKEKRVIESKDLEAYNDSLKLASQYSLSLIESSRDPMFVISVSGIITDTNQATVNVTDVSKNNLIGSDFITYFTDPEKAKKGYEEIFSKGFVVDFPLTIIDHKLTDVLFNGSVYKDDSDTIIGAVAVARDITEQKKTEKELLQSLKEVMDYKLALDVSTIVDITDKNGKILFINDNYLKISKYSNDELMGGTHKMVNSSYHSVAFMKNLWDSISKGKVWQNEIRNKDKEGGYYWLNMTIVPFLDEQGIPYQYVAISIDITNQKLLEKELIEAKIFAELATSIAEDPKIVAETETGKAEEAVKSKQQFLSNMSHEIRTPMNAIIGFTKVVLKTELTAKQKEYLMAIKLSGDALIVLINDILDLAKVDAGKMTFEKTPFKLSLSIKAMLHLFETKIQEKNLTLITHYDKKIPEVLVGDPVRLHQIILNLVSNAVKFTHQGMITVSVTLVSENEKEVVIKFAVSDTGIGIKEIKIKQIFENFQQATSGTSRIFGGTGLGLAIVKQLVNAQGGTIDVKSEFGKGSTFSFNLKLKKTSANAVLEPEILELNTDIKDTKILVVEDMELNQLLMKTVLDDFGFECEIAGNGKIAIEKLKNQVLKKHFDIILMDLQMPEMNGFEATEYIRETMKSNIPIIALTADVTTVDVAKCKAVGMNDYISKPVDERLLYSKLVGLIKKPVVIIEHHIEGKKETDTIKYLDMTYLLRLTKSNPVLMSELINSYLKQTPTLIKTMKQSFQDKDWKLLNATIHKMLPSFSIMGMNNDITEIAKKIQNYANEIELSKELGDLVLELENVCLQTCKELEIELTNLK
jgi:PAS domain S-box-containing protein